MAQIAIGRGERAVAELLLDDVDRHSLGRELGGVGVAQAPELSFLARIR